MIWQRSHRRKQVNWKKIFFITLLFISNYNQFQEGKRLFRNAGFVVRFILRLKKRAERRKLKNPNGRSGSASIFKIRLMEIMSAIHRVYLEVFDFFKLILFLNITKNGNLKPEGPIYGSLMTFIKNPNDMNILFDSKSIIHESCVLSLCQNIEEIVQRITEFMVCWNFFFDFSYFPQKI